MRDMNYLFDQDSLDDFLTLRTRQARENVDQIPEELFLAADDDEIVEKVSARMFVNPIELHEEKKTMKQNETQVDVSGDWDRDLEHHRGPYYVSGTQVIVTIPFSGDALLFKYRTNPFSSTFPSAQVKSLGQLGGKIEITLSAAHDADPQIFKTKLDDKLRSIRLGVKNSGAQVKRYNEVLRGQIFETIQRRRERLERHSGISSILDIPLAVNPNAPSIEPVKLEVVKPTLPPVQLENGQKPEPGIKHEDYEIILHFIRHQGRTYETTPATYSKLDEEDLRNVMLGQLNGHFKGAATGERFRQHGKTDICIEQNNRAAFVGECKNWSGEKGAADAFDQLLGYLTWRDSKAALIIFNKGVKRFSTVQENLASAVRNHPHFIRQLECKEHGEWRALMRSAEDEERHVTVHVFAFNIYFNQGPRIRRV